MVDARDAAILIQHDFIKILKKKLKVRILIDSETIFNVVINNEFITKRRLTIYIKASRESYNDGIVNDIIWIRREHSLADAMTKHTILPRLVKFLQPGKVNS